MKDRQVSFNIKESLEKLQKNMDDLSTHLQDETNAAIAGMAEAAYASITSKVQKTLNSTRNDYLKGLNFEKLEDGSFLISLEGDWANKLEDGYGPYDMVPGMLASSKNVTVGPGSGQPWVKESKPKGKGKQTHKYAHVPIDVQPHSKAAKTSNLADAMKTLQGVGLNGGLQDMMKTFKGSDNRPLEGKVAVAHPDSVTDARLAGLVKYQKIQTSASGKERVRSVYIAYRTISQNGKPWIHPGFSGVQAFEEAEKDIENQIQKLIATLV